MTDPITVTVTLNDNRTVVVTNVGTRLTTALTYQVNGTEGAHYFKMSEIRHIHATGTDDGVEPTNTWEFTGMFKDAGTANKTWVVDEEPPNLANNDGLFILALADGGEVIIPDGSLAMHRIKAL